MTQVVLFNIFNGLIVGAFYALMALGLSLILNLSGVINFAHGGFLALGGYLAYMLLPYIGFWGALIVAPFLTAVLGLVVERVLIRRVYGRDPLYSLLLTFGLAFIFEDGTRFVWGAQSLPFQVPGWLMSPLSSDYFFLTGYRLFMVAVVAIAVAALFLILGRTRLGIRIRAGTLDLETVSVLGVNVRILRNLNFGLGVYLAGLAGVLAVGPARAAADHRRLADHAELRRHHRRRPRQPARHAARRPADRRRLGCDHGVLSFGHRGRHLRNDGGGAAGSPARPARRRRSNSMNGIDVNKQAPNVVVWLLLLAMPFWLPAIGGYIELGSRVVVLGLAAISLNFLLGYTGVLSFGHAAYFGLGAYGVGMVIRYVVPSTGIGILVGTLVGTIAAAIIGPLIIRLRGVYFAMVTIAFGQVFYFIAFRWNSVTGGDDGLIGWTRQPLNFGFTTVDILHSPNTFFYFILALFAVALAAMAFLLRSPFGRTLIAIRETSGAHAFSASRSTSTSGCLG